WEARIAELGEGERENVDAATALDEARAAIPPLTEHCAEPAALGLAAGERVEVTADDFSDRGVVRGRLLQLDPWRISLHRETKRLGDIVVHFPRLGYRLRMASGDAAGQ
ncbi:MAG: glutathione S-transferase family protein, partial [Gammaproteobacteria bacterium]